MVILLVVIVIAILLVCLLTQCLIFKKLGLPAWGAIVPFYRTYLLFDVTYGRGNAVCAASLGVAGWVLMIIGESGSMLFKFGDIITDGISIASYLCWYRVCKYFGHGIGFFLGMCFLPFIFFPILAFEK